jgi:formylglycine-generating enzyme required for sulfatase activity
MEVTLDPMPRARFGEMIEGPADRFGLRLGPGLTERLIEDTRYDDALPLLAFTLERLHAACATDVELTLRAYEDLFPAVQVRAQDGTIDIYRGVSAAIKHSAAAILEETGYAGFSADDPRMRDLRRTSYSLARVGTEGQFTRRRAPQSRIPPSCEEVVKRFVSQRLLVSGAENSERTLSVTHEALFRVWDTLRLWLVQDRKALALRTQIEDAAAEWDAANRAESLAWPEERVLDTVREIDDSGVSLDDVARSDIVRAFLGPTDLEELSTLPTLTETEDGTAGAGRYSDAWRLPLGHEARASVGVRLALSGDRRRGVGLRADSVPEIDWCRIEAGEVTIEIRSNPNDRHSEVVDTRSRTVDPFRIARYPVTITQFQAFLKDCYVEGRWRLPPGFPVDLLADYPPPKHRERYGNHPADTVNWYDAMAFCHWLSARLDADVRLPTEFQWQLAATGGDPANVYPWGPEWEPWRANTYESGLGRSTAVGMYPAGASRAGILDMAGTLYEWCLNAFDDPDDTAFRVTPKDLRAMRGGCWERDHDYARCAYRNWGAPNGRYGGIGFRVVCSSPSSILDH